MHLTSSPFAQTGSLTRGSPTISDDRILRTLLEADDAVRRLLLDHLCAGDEVRRKRLSDLLAAASTWRASDRSTSEVAALARR